jgi:uncharacterized protein (DUF983 family)
MAARSPAAIEAQALTPEDDYPPVPAISTGLAGRCPRCGQGRMFRGFLAVAPRCEVCGLDLAFADAGDGPAVFVMLIAGLIVLGAALWLEFTFAPPIWVHLLVSVPILLVVCLGLLRLLKGVLISLQYRHSAAEGRLER